MIDVTCLRMETLRAEIAETKRYCLLGDRFMAAYHAGRVLFWANKIDHAAARKVAIVALTKLRSVG